MPVLLVEFFFPPESFFLLRGAFLTGGPTNGALGAFGAHRYAIHNTVHQTHTTVTVSTTPSKRSASNRKKLEAHH